MSLDKNDMPDNYRDEGTPIVEEICPFTNCGRKFISNIKLKRHMEMRHTGEAALEKAESVKEERK